MRAIVYQINSKYIHSSLAAWYLFAAAREWSEDCECSVLEGSINESDDVLLERVITTDARAVGFCTYIWNVDKVLAIAERIKAHDPEVKIILGGPEVAYRQKQVLMTYPFVDYVISGEGEVPFSRLLSSISHGTCERIEGVSMRNGEEYTVSAPYEMQCDPPTPYTDEYFSALKSRISYIETSRGCPFSCAYCLSCTQKLRFFDVERSKREILLLANSKSKTVKFVDRTFNANKKRAVDILSFILEKRRCGDIPSDVTFHFEISGELVDGELARIVKDAPAGLFQFEIGVQSFNEDTLRAINRKTDIKKLCSAIKELSSYSSAHIHTDLIAGLPFEDIESFRASYNKLYSLGSHKIQLGFLKLLHGSDMREDPQLYPCEYESRAPYRVKSTPWLSEDDLCELEFAERANDGVFFSSRFDRTVSYLLDSCGTDPYSLAYKLGRELYCGGTPPLDSLFDMLYGAACKMDGVDAMRLRDIMLYDRIAHNNSCVIPKSLKVKDARLKKYSDHLKNRYPLRAGVRRCIGILYTEDKVIFADYENMHPVTERYPVREIDISTIEEELCERNED